MDLQGGFRLLARGFWGVDILGFRRFWGFGVYGSFGVSFFQIGQSPPRADDKQNENKP